MDQKTGSNVRAFGTRDSDDRSELDVLRDALSIAAKHKADGETMGVVVLLLHPDPAKWPKTDWVCTKGELIEAAGVLSAIATHVALEDLMEWS